MKRSKSKSTIPFFREFSELHKALGLDYTSYFKDINLFRYEDARACIDDTPPYRNDFYQIFFIRQSELTGNYNDTHIHFLPTHSYLLFTCPGKLISWRKSGNLHGYIFSFKPTFFLPGLNNNSLIRKFPFFNPDHNGPLIIENRLESDQLRELFEKIAVEFKNPVTDSSEVMGSYVFILLVLAKRLFLSESRQAASSHKKNKIAKEFESLVRKNLSARKSVKDYASLLHVTPKYLSESLKKERGNTARQIIQDILILEAKSLLLQTDLTMAEISQQMGFTDPSHFAKFFRSKTGEVPSAFIKKR
jgi:AraC family transcriptional regulator, transcriptional activator of pobA